MLEIFLLWSASLEDAEDLFGGDVPEEFYKKGFNGQDGESDDEESEGEPESPQELILVKNSDIKKIKNHLDCV